MKLLRTIICLVPTLFVLGGAGSVVRADGYCPDCLEKAMNQHGADMLASIEKAWGQYQAVLEIVRKIEAKGTDQQKAKAREILAQAEAAWKPYESLARQYASPAYAAQMEDYHAYLAEHLDQTRERLHKQTDLYAELSRTTLEDQRQRVLNDMAGFATESNKLKTAFYVDLGIGAFSSVGTFTELYVADASAAVPKVKGLEAAMKKFSASAKNKAALARQSNLLVRLKVAGAIGGGIATDGPQVIKALNEDDSAQKVCAAVQLVADTGLKATQILLVAKPALAAEVAPWINATGARAGYAMLVAPTLDAILLGQAFHQLNEDERRIQAVDAMEQTWQVRIKVSGIELHATERRVKLVETEMSYQKQIADVYARIESAKGQ